MNTLALDIGGTKIASAIVDENGVVSYRSEVPTEPQKGAAHVVERALSLVKQTSELYGQAVRGLGIATGGDVDIKRGAIVYATPVVSDWAGTELRAVFEHAFHLPIWVDNDGNCSALAEAVFGAARGYDEALTLIVGTGIGAGYVVNHSVFRGFRGGALNPGQIWLDNVHTYEDVISCGALSRLYNMPIQQLAELVSVQPAWPIVLKDTAEKIGRLLAICAAILDPQVIVIAGSILLFGERMLQHIRDSYCEYARPPQRDIAIRKSTLDANSALIGASLLS